MKKHIGTLFFVSFSLGLLSQNNSTEKKPQKLDLIKQKTLAAQSNQTPTVELQQVKIGDQIWSATNLNVSTFKNGEVIPEAKTNEDWAKAGEIKTPAWCYFGNDTSMGKKYGKLYNWYALTDPRGLAPADWKIPTESDWNKLVDFLGGNKAAGARIKSNSGWMVMEGSVPDKSIQLSGFNALPGGYRDYGGEFNEEESKGFWWSSSKENERSSAATAYELGFSSGMTYKGSKDLTNGFSVRCIK